MLKCIYPCLIITNQSSVKSIESCTNQRCINDFRLSRKQIILIILYFLIMLSKEKSASKESRISQTQNRLVKSPSKVSDKSINGRKSVETLNNKNLGQEKFNINNSNRNNPRHRKQNELLLDTFIRRIIHGKKTFLFYVSFAIIP